LDRRKGGQEKIVEILERWKREKRLKHREKRRGYRRYDGR
jgi:hypothetical protein